MRQQSAKVFLSYLRELAREAGVPADFDFGGYIIEVIIRDGQIFEVKINGKGTVRVNK